MTRLMYDSVNAWAIPADVPMVAGYVDCSFAWTPAAWARFPNAVKVRIAAGCNPLDAQVADVENGDYLPWEAVDFCLVQRAKGIDPTVYVNLSNWSPTRTEFQLRGVAEPHWWLAHYDGVAEVPAGCVAKQYANSAMTGANFDLSIVADAWPGVDSTFGPGGGTIAPDMNTDEHNTLLQVYYLLTTGRDSYPGGGGQRPLIFASDLAAIKASLANITAVSGGGLSAADEQLLKDCNAKLDRVLAELHTP